MCGRVFYFLDPFHYSFRVEGERPPLPRVSFVRSTWSPLPFRIPQRIRSNSSTILAACLDQLFPIASRISTSTLPYVVFTTYRLVISGYEFPLSFFCRGRSFPLKSRQTFCSVIMQKRKVVISCDNLQSQAGNPHFPVIQHRKITKRKDLR